MLPSHNWRYNSASGLRSRTDFNNRLTHRIQYSPIDKARRARRGAGFGPSQRKVHDDFGRGDSLFV